MPSDPVAVRIKRLPNGGGLPLPAYATDGAAGMDVVAAESLTLRVGRTVAVATGLALGIPDGWEVQVRPRSGLALNHGLTVPNAPGTIDSDFTGELKVVLRNEGTDDFAVKRGERIAQLVLAPVHRVRWEEVDSLPDTGRGSDGFGSTGR